MKLATFMVAAIATAAIGVGSAQAQDDGWHLNYTLNTSSKIAAPYTAANARVQPQAALAVVSASDDHAYGMTYTQG